MVILLVDDNPTDLALVSIALKRQCREELTLLQAESCHEAVALTETTEIHCIVMDQRLIGTQGLACVKKLRDLHWHGALVLLTNFADEHEAIESMHLGADDYLSKATINEELWLAIAKAIDRRKEVMRSEEKAQEKTEQLEALHTQLEELQKRVLTIRTEAATEEEAATSITDDLGKLQEKLERVLNRTPKP